jgi:hypothetical protein
MQPNVLMGSKKSRTGFPIRVMRTDATSVWDLMLGCASRYSVYLRIPMSSPRLLARNISEYTSLICFFCTSKAGYKDVPAGTQFNCLTRTKVQILTHRTRFRQHSVSVRFTSTNVQILTHRTSVRQHTLYCRGPPTTTPLTRWRAQTYMCIHTHIYIFVFIYTTYIRWRPILQKSCLHKEIHVASTQP